MSHAHNDFSKHSKHPLVGHQYEVIKYNCGVSMAVTIVECVLYDF